jgi:hypothetical protein
MVDRSSLSAGRGMTSPEEIARNLTELHAHQRRCALWMRAALFGLVLASLAVVYRALNWVLPHIGQQ